MHGLSNSDLPPRILVVDDDPLVCRMTVRALSERGYACCSATNVSDALDRAGTTPPDVVITDIHLPGASGLELLLALKKQHPDTEVLIFTGFSSVETAVRALTEGAFAYLTKPLDMEALFHQIARALEHRLLLIERRQYTELLEERVREKTEELQNAYHEMTERLVRACCFRDVETGAHIRRVGLLSAALARIIGWPEWKVESIRVAAPLHDIGKTAIPDGILCKPGKLTEEEMQVMKTHTIIGAELLYGARSPVMQMAREIALCHHERWDGMGYPRGLCRTRIPEPARIVAVTDVYDALSHDRVYRRAYPRQRVVKMLQEGSGTQFDPSCLEPFLAHLPLMERILQEHPDEFEPNIRELLPDYAALSNITADASTH